MKSINPTRNLRKPLIFKLLAKQLRGLPLAVAFTGLILGGCAGSGKEADPTADWTAQQFYKNAKNELKSGDYELAVEYFETLESRFPFGSYAEQAQLETGYAYYKYNEYDSAIAAADRFIKLHPTHPNVDYAYYLRGLAAFHKKDAPLDSIAPQDPALRDPSSARESFNYFAELVKRFPNSRYTADAIKRMKFQRNTLAEHEIYVANYYLKRGAYVAVVNRAKYVVENYPQTPSVARALELLSLAYARLDMHDLAADAKRVLLKNYPDFQGKMPEETTEN
ncbi:MAG: outer membrane protein assembly factor BamD [Gammaproteobacteria bacterium]|jgi:outer membrane protein assembly factor BamD